MSSESLERIARNKNVARAAARQLSMEQLQKLAEVVEEVIKILVEGVQIEEEIGEACVDYSQSNWIGFGYNIAKLLKMML